MEVNPERDRFFSLGSEIFGGGGVVSIFPVSSPSILSLHSYVNAIKNIKIQRAQTENI